MYVAILWYFNLDNFCSHWSLASLHCYTHLWLQILGDQVAKPL